MQEEYSGQEVCLAFPHRAHRERAQDSHVILPNPFIATRLPLPDSHSPSHPSRHALEAAE